MLRHLVFLIMMLAGFPALAQDSLSPDLQRHSWDVFLLRNDADPTETELIFVDLLTGESSRLDARGESFLLTDSGVVYLDTDDAQVKLAQPDGIIRDHPFISISASDYRIDWVVSADRQLIAWTISRQLEEQQLSTSVWLADVAGTEIRELLVYGPREGIRLLPIAFRANDVELFLEVHPDGISDRQAYTQRAGLSAINLSDGGIRTLPGDQSCFCAVAFGDEHMLRLPRNAEANGIDVEIQDLGGSTPIVIPSISRGNYDEAGNPMFSPDESLAVYALSQVSGLRTAQQEVRTVFVQVDLRTARQSIVSAPIAALVRPISWTEDNSAILFTSEAQNGTWKLGLEGGQIVKVADAIYLGLLLDS